MSNTWKWYAKGLKHILKADLDLDAATFKVALYTSSKTITQTTDDTYSATNEVANGNGYATGGAAATLTVAQGTGAVEVRITDPITWSSSTITARHAILYNAAGSNYVLGYMTFGDATPADVVSSNGNFTIDESDSNAACLKITY